MKSLLAMCAVLLLTSESLAKQLPVKSDPAPPAGGPAAPRSSALGLLPDNTVAIVGSTVVLRCGVADPQVGHTHQWTEYAYFELGGIISANQLIGAHPQALRYRIIWLGNGGEEGEYSLEISSVQMEDGGTYMCMDTLTTGSDKRQHFLELTVMAPAPNCFTTIPPSGVVFDEAYHTNECTWAYSGGLTPHMEWFGPGNFEQLQTSSDATVFAGMQFNVQNAMDDQSHQCETYFTNYFHPVPPNSADNVPMFRNVFVSTNMSVVWSPRNVEIVPEKVRYDAGDILTCTADAQPPADYRWLNVRTIQEYEGRTLRVDEEWRGHNQSVACTARNVINGFLYTGNKFIAVDVNPLTTTDTTTQPTTTTPPPAVSPCRDLTGSWIADAPTPGRLCIELDLDNYGALTGLFTNGTDSYSLDIVGRSQDQNFGQVGFNGIHPAEEGVSSFIGECHRCFGVEQLLVNVVHRSKGAQFCGMPGSVEYATLYHFSRSDNPANCPGFPANPTM